MSMVKWDPFKNIVTLQDRINRYFDEAFPRTPGSSEDLSVSDWHPHVDIFEIESGVALHVDLPGVAKEDVSVEVKENALIIKGKRKADADVSQDGYYRRERPMGMFQRSFVMHTAVVPDTIKATFKNGVLKIEVPKPQDTQPKQVSVNIE